jgi:hypothetical protein
MSLFGETDARFSEIERILKDINVNRMTPIEALTVLNDLKKILGEEIVGKINILDSGVYNQISAGEGSG